MSVDCCGKCPKFQRNKDASRFDWEGTCTEYGVGRMRGSDPCLKSKDLKSTEPPREGFI